MRPSWLHWASMRVSPCGCCWSWRHWELSLSLGGPGHGKPSDGEPRIQAEAQPSRANGGHCPPFSFLRRPALKLLLQRAFLGHFPPHTFFLLHIVGELPRAPFRTRRARLGQRGLGYLHPTRGSPQGARGPRVPPRRRVCRTCPTACRTEKCVTGRPRLIVPAAPLGGIVPIPTVGGDALATPGQGCWPSGACPPVNTNPPGDGYGTPAPPAGNDQSLCVMAQAASTAAWAKAAMAKKPKKKAAAIVADGLVVAVC